MEGELRARVELICGGRSWGKGKCKSCKWCSKQTVQGLILSFELSHCIQGPAKVCRELSACKTPGWEFTGMREKGVGEENSIQSNKSLLSPREKFTFGVRNNYQTENKKKTPT